MVSLFSEFGSIIFWYEAEICTILFLLRCSFIWYHFLPNSNFQILAKIIASERASQEEQNAANFSFVARSSEE